MSALSSVRYQYRSFTSIYLFKFKNDEELSLKILDVSQKCLFKRTFSSQNLTHNVEYLLAKREADVLLESLVAKVEVLVEQGLLPRQLLIPKSKKVTLKTCEKILDRTIEQFKPQILVEREIEAFICPITLEFFREPVIDEHGHTFEKNAIEDYLKRKNACPLSRKPIRSLTPNRIVQQIIEEWQKQDPIPNFSLFQKENPKLASSSLQLAKTYAEEKEYNEALEFYTKAFQYTKNWTDYVSLPPLFEAMGETEKAALAYLYLAKYQLQDGKIFEAIQTLATCQREKSFSLQNNLVLIELYYHSGQPEKALALSIQTAKAVAKRNPKQAITLYKRILRDHPAELSLYAPLAALVESPQEKAHILLQGALQALQEADYLVAERLVQEAENYSETSFVDELISLELIKKQGDLPQVKQKLLYLARSFEKKGLTRNMISAYKMLFQLEKEAAYCQKILIAYRALQKPQQELKWSFTFLSSLIEQEEWEQAEALAKEVLQRTQDSQQHVFFYEKLEEIYTQWHGHELIQLWPKLGKTYLDCGLRDAAENTYRKAFERFHQFKVALALAKILGESGKVKESVHIYYEAAIEALLEKKTQKLFLCTREIKRIDPHLQYLDLNQRMHFLTQEHILRLSDELQTAHQRIASLEHTVQSLKGNTIQEEKRKLAKKEEKTRLVEIGREKSRDDLSDLWFGKAQWEKYFGDVGIEPPLPRDIVEILESPCPYWRGKKVEETHLLVLIPKTINGKPLTLNTLHKFIQCPQGDGYTTEYQIYFGRSTEIFDQTLPSSYWALMTKDVLPNSRKKTYCEQQALMKGPYTAPLALEIATGILTHYVQTGKMLYSQDPKTYTNCQETLGGDRQVMVGAFNHAGLCFDRYPSDYISNVIGLGGVRKF